MNLRRFEMTNPFDDDNKLPDPIEYRYTQHLERAIVLVTNHRKDGLLKVLEMRVLQACLNLHMKRLTGAMLQGTYTLTRIRDDESF